MTRSRVRMASRKTSPATSNGDSRLNRDTPPAGPAITVGSRGLLVGVRVSPSAPRTALRGLYGDRLKIAVNAPPEDNRANNELVEALAQWLGLRRDEIHIETGHGSRDKVIAFAGISAVRLREKLTGLLEADRT